MKQFTAFFIFLLVLTLFTLLLAACGETVPQTTASTSASSTSATPATSTLPAVTTAPGLTTTAVTTEAAVTTTTAAATTAATAATTAATTTEEKMGLTSPEAIAAYRDAVWNDYVASLPESRKTELQKNKITTFTVRGKTMKVQTVVRGTKPTNGYPIFIVLHGGGSDPTGEMNESQWSGMAARYSNSPRNVPGIFVSCRAIEDTWNCHSVDNAFMFYDRIIENATLFLKGDPNRVYIVGYSAGGDGVYQIATRMSDRFAAANMTAGHPNGVSMINTYNLPFYLQVGELDNGYNRFTETVTYSQLLDRLQKTYGGYPHDVFVHSGKEHGVVGDNATSFQTVVKDTDAWLKAGGKAGVGGTENVETHAGVLMSRHTRNPLPERIVWDLSCRTPAARRINSFYWLSAVNSVKEGILDISYDKATNTISVKQCTLPSGKITVYINEEMLDLFKDVTFDFLGEKTTFTPVLSEKLIETTTKERGDRNFQFVSKITFDTKGAVTVG